MTRDACHNCTYYKPHETMVVMGYCVNRHQREAVVEAGEWCDLHSRTHHNPANCTGACNHSPQLCLAHQRQKETARR